MKNFEVTVDVTMTCRISVEAENEKHAEGIAGDKVKNDPWYYAREADSCADIVVVEVNEED